MFPAGFTFKPAPLPTLATVIMVILTALMGTWQLNRAAEKAALQQEYDLRATAPPMVLPASILDATQVAFRKFEAYGRFEEKWQIYLDNKIHNGVAGFHIIAPLRVHNSDVRVLVNRGWVGAGRARHTLPSVVTPPEEVRIVGVAQIPSKKIFELSADTIQGKVWQNINLENYQKTVPFAIQPFVLLQQNGSNDGLVREWPRPDTGRSMHLGYTFQWYALSIVLIIIYIVVNAKRIQ